MCFGKYVTNTYIEAPKLFSLVVLTKPTTTSFRLTGTQRMGTVFKKHLSHIKTMKFTLLIQIKSR